MALRRRTVCVTGYAWQAQRALEFYGGGTAVAEWGAVPLVYRQEKEGDLYYVRGYQQQDLPRASKGTKD